MRLRQQHLHIREIVENELKGQVKMEDEGVRLSVGRCNYATDNVRINYVVDTFDAVDY